MIDTHCHIDMYSNPMEIVNESERLGIVTIGMTNLPSHFKKGIIHVQGYSKIRLALGLHPLLAKNHTEELPIFYECLNKTSYIGEIGLDFSREGISSKELQISSFKNILEAIGNKHKILSIHSRRAEKEVLHLLNEYQIQNAIFHWYSGSLNLVDKIVKSGYFFSINPAMIRSENGRRIIQKIPADFILTESDGPYVNFQNRSIRPKDVEIVIGYLSKLFGIDYQSMENKIKNNFDKLINRIK